jgi:adenine-specific DNA-methyltransferase
MSQEPDPNPDVARVDLQSLDVADQKRQELLRLFPEVRTEGGRIDFDRLKLTLGAIVDVGKERYGLTWPGKAECFRTIQRPSTATLRPMRDESVNFDTTENLIIEGDNLEVLKLLQKAYLGKVKLIYIDPPYNTGNDFIYPDNYTESLQTYLEYTGQVDAEGKKFSTNTEADGRFHSKWLNMMYPRLHLARNLLSDDGIIFVSIDDGELVNLRRVLDEILGEENFIAQIIWQKVYSPKNSARHFSADHDYVVAYARNAEEWRPQLLERTAAMEARYSNPDGDPRGPWKPGDLSARNYYSEGTYPIVCPSGRRIEGPPSGSYWRYSEARFKELDADGRIWWGAEGNNVPAIKRFLSEVRQGKVPQTLWTYSEVGHTQDAKRELLEAVGFESSDNVIDSVKPTGLVKRMLQVATEPNDSCVVLDFFGGTGTTGQAVLEQNAADAGNRRFVLVQLPEPLAVPESKLKTIADVTRARVRKTGVRLTERQSGELKISAPTDVGFRALSLSESNLLAWDDNASTTNELEQQLSLHVHHLRDGRTHDDLLFEILLKEGFPPTTRSDSVDVATQVAQSLEEGALIICLSRDLDLEAIRAIADRGPQRVVCLDEGFAGNDQLKANAAQIFKTKGIVFRTV